MSFKKMLEKLLLVQLVLGTAILPNDNNGVAKYAKDVCPIKIGSEIPSAIIKDIYNKEIDLKELTKNQKSIIIFYRGGWCPYCNLHLSELQDVEADLLALGYNIIAISMDKAANLSVSKDKHKLNYKLYSDSKAYASKSFGIAFTVEPTEINKLKSYNMDLEASSGETHHILPVPSVFIIDENGIIKFEYVNPNYKERISGKLLLQAAKN